MNKIHKWKSKAQRFDVHLIGIQWNMKYSFLDRIVTNEEK